MAFSFEFDAAVSAHKHWIQKLEFFTYSTNPVEVDMDAASDFNRCALGLWLNGAGQQFSGLGSFPKLQQAHRLFHTTAGDVVCLMRENQASMAEFLLKGQLAELSKDIVLLIEDLKREYHAATE